VPVANVVARIYPATISASVALLGFVLLLTPTGSPPSTRWRRWGWGAAVVMAVTLVASMVAPGSLDPMAQFVEGPMDAGVYGGALRTANQLALLVALLVLLAGAASLVVRFRRARGVERLQLRWVALAAALTGLAMLAAAVLIAAGRVNLGSWASVAALTFLPLAAGAAILRYRLYDLDRIVSRTVAYGLLTLLSGPATPPSSWGWGGCWARAPAWSWPRPPWPWRRCSSRCAAGSSRWWTGGSTGAATTPTGWWPPSGPGCATRSTWTP